LFDDQGEFLAFGSNALQLNVEMLDDEETAMLL
jgi:molecular chaperone DnaK (HSP70)